MKTLGQIPFDFSSEDTSYLTHSFHPYPAKFPPQLPRNLLAEFCKSGERALDPFCGSGTTLVEARLRGVHSVGVDINGLACLLSKVKSTPLSSGAIQAVTQTLQVIETESLLWQMGQRRQVRIPKIEGLAHWFQSNVAEELAFIRETILQVDDEDARDFLKIVLSAIIVRVSNQESDTRFAAINKNIPDGFTFKVLLERGRDFLRRMEEFCRLARKDATVHIYNADARDLSFLNSESFDLIITSPPYANTYDYYLYHKFRKRWLDIDVEFAQYKEIGSRREFSSLKRQPEKWIADLEQCLREMARVLKPHKPAFIVIGDSVIQKRRLKMNEIVATLAPRVGFCVRDVISSDLSTHSKLFNPAFTQRGKKEHLIFLEKSNG